MSQKSKLIRIFPNYTTTYNLLSTIYSGFTLIELLIVIAIMGGLATIFITNFPASQGRARDSLRRNDLKQYQSALEVYANRNNGFYPSRTASVQANTTLCTDLSLPAGDCAADPRDGLSQCSGSLCRYYYRSDGTCTAGTACGINYFLYARLERPRVVATPYWFVCSNGETGEVASVPLIGVACPVP